MLITKLAQIEIEQRFKSKSGTILSNDPPSDLKMCYNLSSHTNIKISIY